MTVRKIAISIARLLQADDIEEMLESSYGDVDATSAAERDEDVKLLVECVNNAVFDACADGFPVTLCEVVTASGGEIPLSSLTRTVCTVKRVDDEMSAVTFELEQDRIKVPHDGSYLVTYTVEPETAALDDDMELGILCDRGMLTYLAARNYCLVTGRTDEASVWDQMYETRAVRKRLGRRARLPRRVWG